MVHFYPTQLNTPKSPALSHAPMPQFGWNENDDLPDDFGVIDLKEVPVKSRLSPLPFDRDFFWRPNPSHLALKGFPYASNELVDQVENQLKREGPNFLEKPGFAYIVTPYPWSSEDNENHVKARYLALDLMGQLQARSIVPETEQSRIQASFWNDYLTGMPGGTTTYKKSHMDVDTLLLGLVYGPESLVKGAYPQVSDILDYFYTEKEPPNAHLEKLRERGSVVPTNYDSESLSPMLQQLEKGYTRTLKKGSELGRITIMVLNNLPGLLHRGVFHGATPGTFLNPEEDVLSTAPRQLYQIGVRFPEFNPPKPVKKSINLLMKDGLKALNQIIEPEPPSKKK